MGRVDLEEITNTRIYQDIAFLIDREEVLETIISLRRKTKKLQHKSKKLETLTNFLLYSPDIRFEVTKLLKRYKYPPGFSKAFIAAIRKNKITDKDVKNCYFHFHIERSIDKSLPPLDTPREGILITMYPYLLKHRKKLIVQEISELLTLVTQDLINLPIKHPLRLDVRNKIRLEREWYWKNKNKISTQTIADDYNKTKSDENEWINDINRIDQAISDYRKLLKTVF